mgnify:FL=1
MYCLYYTCIAYIILVLLYYTCIACIIHYYFIRVLLYYTCIAQIIHVLLVLYMYCLYYLGWSNSSTCNDDIDECSTDPAACNNQGNCTNTEGSFICTCNQYWTGDGEYLSISRHNTLEE